jgi:quinoprotein glucose dehydrogenase
MNVPGKPILICTLLALLPIHAGAQDWSHWGGDVGGKRFAEAPTLNPETADRLEEAWRSETGDTANGEGYFGRTSSFKSTPILVADRLIVTTPFNRVLALDPGTGEELWRFDPEVDFTIKYSEMFTSRGAAAFVGPNISPDTPCHTRILLGTLDARLIAVDAATGKRCLDFGESGEVDLTSGIRRVRRGEYSVTSPPTVVNGVVVVGSSIGDNGSARLEDGTVRGFDALTGELLWSFNPIPQGPDDDGAETWPDESYRQTGAANVWSVMAADPQRDLIFLPTTSPSPDFFGGSRPGDNIHANSLVTLKATTGELVWAYQVVRHDLWDYDLASQPLVVDIEIEGVSTPVVAQATKMGFVFVLNRETGEPIHAVEERQVPRSDVPGETAAQTQRFPAIQLHELADNLPPIFAVNDDHVARCEEMIAGARYEGIFTPPSLEGTVLFPGNPGGVNWGSMAADEAEAIAVVAVNRLPTVVKLIPRDEFRKLRRGEILNGVEAQFTSQSGTPYGMARFELFNNESGFHCLEGPWSTLVAVNLASGERLWEVPAGRRPGIGDDHQAAEWGYVANGGPVLTSGGLAFMATQYDRMLRAYDQRDGKVVWSTQLPAGPQATPMIYEWEGEAYLAITLGGREANGEMGDYVVTYRLNSDRDQ